MEQLVLDVRQLRVFDLGGIVGLQPSPQGGLEVGTVVYQGAQDRVTYHELQPQNKIQVVRLRLFARVRSFDPISEEWGMRVTTLPTNSTDWWHARLHFVTKD